MALATPKLANATQPGFTRRLWLTDVIPNMSIPETLGGKVPVRPGVLIGRHQTGKILLNPQMQRKQEYALAAQNGQVDVLWLSKYHFCGSL